MASASSGWGPISRRYSKNALASKGSQLGTDFLPWGVLDAIGIASTYPDLTLSRGSANDFSTGDESPPATSIVSSRRTKREMSSLERLPESTGIRTREEEIDSVIAGQAR